MSATDMPGISFRATQKRKMAILTKAESMGISVSELLNHMVSYYFEKEEREEVPLLNERMARAGILGVKLKLDISKMFKLAVLAKFKKNGANWPEEIDELLQAVIDSHRYIKEKNTTDDLKKLDTLAPPHE